MIKFDLKFDSRKLEKEARKAAEDHVRQIARRTVCPVHKQSATIRFKGIQRNENLDFNVNSCCDENVDRVITATKRS